MMCSQLGASSGLLLTWSDTDSYAQEKKYWKVGTLPCVCLLNESY